MLVDTARTGLSPSESSHSHRKVREEKGAKRCEGRSGGRARALVSWPLRDFVCIILYMLLLDADVLHLLLEELGVIEYLRASSCHAWLNAGVSLPPDHPLWRAACLAESPLLLEMHAPTDGGTPTWRSLVKQRRCANKLSVSTWEGRDTELRMKLLLELRNGAGTVVSTGRADLHVYFSRDSLMIRLDMPLRISCGEGNLLTLGIYLIDGSRMCCLGSDVDNDMDDFNFWFTACPGPCEIHLKARYEYLGEPIGAYEFDEIEDYVWEKNNQGDEVLALTHLELSDEDDGEPLSTLLSTLADCPQVQHVWQSM